MCPPSPLWWAVGCVACCPSPARRHWHCRRELARKWSGVSVTRSRSYLHPAVVLRLCSADHNRARAGMHGHISPLFKCAGVLSVVRATHWLHRACSAGIAPCSRPVCALDSFGPRCGGNLGASPLHKSLLSVGARSGKGKEKKKTEQISCRIAWCQCQCQCQP